MNYRIGIIGAGNMGSTFYRGLSKNFPKEALFICDRNEQKFIGLKAIHFTTVPKELAVKTGIVILAVKPQAFDELMKEMGDSLKDKLVVSIMAGISIKKIREKTGSDRIVRSMPSLPTQVGSGIIGWIATDPVTDEEKEMIQTIFSTMGYATELADEKMVDAITVIGACGPAYFYYLAELLTEKARKFGFSEKEARKISEVAFSGSAKLLENNDKTAKEWKEACTSKGGVTEAMLNYFDNHDFAIIFNDALDTGLKRCSELNDQ
ncbi:pyrroline-5-carboxylate reductase [Candidatus Peregrinibacteria bacterium]|nr:pyrroline-5-carboxylate reductase [Candidatus Peregrinibacteria bacterium]